MTSMGVVENKRIVNKKINIHFHRVRGMKTTTISTLFDAQFRVWQIVMVVQSYGKNNYKDYKEINGKLLCKYLWPWLARNTAVNVF